MSTTAFCLGRERSIRLHSTPVGPFFILESPYSTGMRSSTGAGRKLSQSLWQWRFLLILLGISFFCTPCCAHQYRSLQQETESTQEEGVSVLGVFTVMLVIGVASYHVLAFTRIPYTAILIVRLSEQHNWQAEPFFV